MLLAQTKLRSLATAERKESNHMWYKKTSTNPPVFLGVTGVDVTLIAKEFKNLSMDEIKILIESPYSEERMLGIKILIKQFASKKSTDLQKDEIFNFAFSLRNFYDQWNFIDAISPHILSHKIKNPKDHEFNILLQSNNWIDARILLVSQIYYAKKATNLDVSLNLAKQYFNHKERLVQQALGWLLKECYKYHRDDAKEQVKKFILENQKLMPKISFRIACEHFRKK